MVTIDNSPARRAHPGWPGATADKVPGAHAAPGPLVVRLRNWVGDVLLGLPMLQRLADAGHELHLVGKGWARDLLVGHGWPVHVLPRTLAERVQLLRRLRVEVSLVRARATAPARIDALCLPYSFSSALEFRLAGLRALGHAHEGRSWLLARALPLHRGRHELETYWELGEALLGIAALPRELGLVLAPQHREAAAELRRAHGLAEAPIVVCPFAGGTYDRLPKSWPQFSSFVRLDLTPLAAAQGRRVLICPGPGEEAAAREAYGDAVCLPNVGLGAYAALLAEAALMVSNDTGPGHMAAAVGTPLLSVLGPTDPAQWGAWGPGVQCLGGGGHWPARAEVLAAAQALLHQRAGR